MNILLKLSNQQIKDSLAGGLVITVNGETVSDYEIQEQGQVAGGYIIKTVAQDKADTLEKAMKAMSGGYEVVKHEVHISLSDEPPAKPVYTLSSIVWVDVEGMDVKQLNNLWSKLSGKKERIGYNEERFTICWRTLYLTISGWKYGDQRSGSSSEIQLGTQITPEQAIAIKSWQ